MVRRPCDNHLPGNLHPSNCRQSNRRPSNHHIANTETCKVPHVSSVSGRRPSAGSEPEAVAAARIAPEAPAGATRATVRSAAVVGAGRTVVVRTRTLARLWVCADCQNTFPTGPWPRRSSTVAAADDWPRRRPAWVVLDLHRQSSSCLSSTRPRTRTVRCCSSTRRPS